MVSEDCLRLTRSLNSMMPFVVLTQIAVITENAPWQGEVIGLFRRLSNDMLLG
jgi:hypothetical protein